MSTETESRLRAALAAAAQHITADQDELPTAPGRRVRHSMLWPALAAAAVVVLVAALAVGLHASRHSAPPSHPTTPAPTTSRSAAPTGSPTRTVLGVVDGLHPARCRAANGDAWLQAARMVVPDQLRGIPYSGLLPLFGVDDHGEVIAIQQTSPTSVVAADPHTGTLRTLVTAPDSVAGVSPVRLDGAAVEADWALFTVITGGGQGSLAGIELVNTTTREIRIVRDPALGGELIVPPPILVDGTVYWSETTNFGLGHVYSYSIATGQQRTLDSGQVLGPFTIAGGVYWPKGPAVGPVVTYRPGALPPGYVVQAKLNPPVVSDGHLTAWTQQTGQRTDLVVRRGTGPAATVLSAPTAQTPIPLAIAGPYLLWLDTGQTQLTALDLRTGATTSVGTDPGFTLAASHGNTLAYDILGSKGGHELLVADTTRLPQLHC